MQAAVLLGAPSTAICGASATRHHPFSYLLLTERHLEDAPVNTCSQSCPAQGLKMLLAAEDGSFIDFDFVKSAKAGDNQLAARSLRILTGLLLAPSAIQWRT